MLSINSLVFSSSHSKSHDLYLFFVVAVQGRSFFVLSCIFQWHHLRVYVILLTSFLLHFFFLGGIKNKTAIPPCMCVF